MKGSDLIKSLMESLCFSDKIILMILVCVFYLCQICVLILDYATKGIDYAWSGIDYATKGIDYAWSGIDHASELCAGRKTDYSPDLHPIFIGRSR